MRNEKGGNVFLTGSLYFTFPSKFATDSSVQGCLQRNMNASRLMLLTDGRALNHLNCAVIQY